MPLRPTQRNKLRHEAWKAHAYAIMNALIRRRIIYPAHCYDCQLCGNRAGVWEHRDYTQPFDIYPACHSCNSFLSCGNSPHDIPPPKYTSQSILYRKIIRACPRISGDNPTENAVMVRHALGLDWPLMHPEKPSRPNTAPSVGVSECFATRKKVSQKNLSFTTPASYPLLSET